MKHQRKGGCRVFRFSADIGFWNLHIFEMRDTMQNFMMHPQTGQGRFELGRRVAKIHAECVAGAVNRLGCPTWQKLQLVDAVIRQFKKTAG